MRLPTCSSRVPLLFACCSVVRRRVAAPCATLAGTTEPGPSFRSGKLEDDFLVRNDRNDVQVLQCPSIAVLRQGMAETSALPHLCVAGESNAGKSSMINHLLKKNLAKASSVAGKTRSVDMMLVNSKMVLTDLPGLPSRDHQVEKLWASSWEPLVLAYIRECRSLRAMVYAHDVRWKVTPIVRDFLRTVQEEGLPVILVLTKDDKLADEGGKEPMVERRIRLSSTIRKSLDFGGLHINYSTDNSIPTSRRARRSLLRLIEDLVAVEGEREACTQLLEEKAAKKQGHAPSVASSAE